MAEGNQQSGGQEAWLLLPRPRPHVWHWQDTSPARGLQFIKCKTFPDVFSDDLSRTLSPLMWEISLEPAVD